MQTDLLIDGSGNETDEAKHRKRVLARRRKGFEMLASLRMELHRQRADGVPFAEAWDAARDTAMRGLVGRERAAWNKALNETRWAWRGAYLRQPDEKVAAVALLGEPFDAAAVSGLRDAGCVGLPLPPLPVEVGRGEV